MLPGRDLTGGSPTEIKRGGKSCRAEKVVGDTLMHPAISSLALFPKGLWVGFLLSSGKDKLG